MGARSGETRSQFDQTAAPIITADLPYSVRTARGLTAGHIVVPMSGKSTGGLATDPGRTHIRTHQVTNITVPGVLGLLSSDDDDMPSSPGAHSVQVWGLPPGGDHTSGGGMPPWQSETVTLNGTTEVFTFQEYSTIDGIEVVGRGSVGTNVGDIDARLGVTAHLRIPAGRTISRCSRVSVPDGWEALVRKIQVFWSGNSPAIWELHSFNNGNLKILYDGEVVAANSGNSIDMEGGIRILSETVVWFRGARTTGAPLEDMQVNAWLDLHVVDDAVVPGVPVF